MSQMKFSGVFKVMLYRTVSDQELADIISRSGFHPGPPSFQGKWFAEAPEHAAEWGRRLFHLGGNPFHVVEVEVPQSVANQFFRLSNLDGVGAAEFVDVDQLPLLNGTCRAIREVGVIPLGGP